MELSTATHVRMVDAAGRTVRHDDQYGCRYRGDEPYSVQSVIEFCAASLCQKESTRSVPFYDLPKSFGADTLDLDPAHPSTSIQKDTAEKLIAAANCQGLEISTTEADLILGYLEGHEYSLMVDAAGRTVRHDDQYGCRYRGDEPYRSVPSVRQGLAHPAEAKTDSFRPISPRHHRPGSSPHSSPDRTRFLCGAPADSDHFTSLTTEQIEQYRKMFYTPEMFWGMDGRIVCLPLEVH